MKKIVKILAVTLVCVLAATALVACGDKDAPVPNLDFDTAKTNLEKAEYYIEYNVSGMEKFVGLDEDAIEKSLLAMIEYDWEYSELTHMSFAKEGLEMFLCKDEDNAKKLYEFFNKQKDSSQSVAMQDANVKAELEYLKNNGTLDEETYAKVLKSYESLSKSMSESKTYSGISGKIVWVGTENAINDTK